MPAFDSPIAADARDLSDAEIDELDRLLAEAPEPCRPMGVVTLDGYLCGVLVQPAQVEPEEWLPYVFDADGAEPPRQAAGPWHERAVSLILRRQRALARMLYEDGAFDPLVEDDPDDETVARVPAASRPLVDWVAGFDLACELFPMLEELDDDAVNLALARIWRHLPAEDAQQRAVQALLDKEAPLQGVDDAIDDLVAAVADVADLTRDLRFQVETVRRATPKVGRNDPCPCGSGKKYKRCHGAAA